MEIEAANSSETLVTRHTPEEQTPKLTTPRKPYAGNDCLSRPNVAANTYHDVAQRHVQLKRATVFI
jgi:hypothetical protein